MKEECRETVKIPALGNDVLQKLCIWDTLINTAMTITREISNAKNCTPVFTGYSCCKRIHLQGQAVGQMEMTRSKVINGFGQSIGTNWRQGNCNQSLNQMCLEKSVQIILINAGQQCLLMTHQHPHLQQVTISRAILMRHQTHGFHLDRLKAFKSKEMCI